MNNAVSMVINNLFSLLEYWHPHHQGRTISLSAIVSLTWLYATVYAMSECIFGLKWNIVSKMSRLRTKSTSGKEASQLALNIFARQEHNAHVNDHRWVCSLTSNTLNYKKQRKFHCKTTSHLENSAKWYLASIVYWPGNILSNPGENFKL